MTTIRSVRTIGSIMLMLVVTLMLAGCAQGVWQDVTDLFPLRDELIQTYHEEDVNIVVQNGNTLGISFVNSTFNDLPSAAAKQAKAREIAQFAKTHYARVDHVDAIWVSFVVHKTYFLVFSYTNGLDTFFFKTNDLDYVMPLTPKL
jgi:hypothetical protein